MIDNLVQLEENFNSRKTSSENSQKTVGKHRKTAENIGKHLKSSNIILRTTEDPSQIIQFSLKRISTVRPKSCGGVCWGGVGWLSQTRPIPRSPDSDNKVVLSPDGQLCITLTKKVLLLLSQGVLSNCILLSSTNRMYINLSVTCVHLHFPASI